MQTPLPQAYQSLLHCRPDLTATTLAETAHLATAIAGTMAALSTVTPPPNLTASEQAPWHCHCRDPGSTADGSLTREKESECPDLFTPPSN